jgi:uncharacterized membrane protein
MTERKIGPVRAEKPLSTIGQKLTWRDVAEIAIGSCALAFPVSVTEEVWELSKTLPLGRVLYLAFWSNIFIGFFTYQRYFRGRLRGNVGKFLLRVFATYAVTALNCATILAALNQLFSVEVAIAINRVIIISFPGSLAATIVDGMSKDEAPIEPGTQDPDER